MNAFALRQSGKVLVALLVVSAALYFWLVIQVGSQIHQASGDVAVHQQLMGITILEGHRVGQVSTVQPGFGLILLVAIPFLLAALVYVVAARRRR